MSYLPSYFDDLGIKPEEILSLNSTAIKKAYHKSMMRHHPDKNPGIDTTQASQCVTKAYQVLSNLRLSCKCNLNMELNFFSNPEGIQHYINTHKQRLRNELFTKDKNLVYTHHSLGFLSSDGSDIDMNKLAILQSLVLDKMIEDLPESVFTPMPPHTSMPMLPDLGSLDDVLGAAQPAYTQPYDFNDLLTAFSGSSYSAPPAAAAAAAAAAASTPYPGTGFRPAAGAGMGFLCRYCHLTRFNNEQQRNKHEWNCTSRKKRYQCQYCLCANTCNTTKKKHEYRHQAFDVDGQPWKYMNACRFCGTYRAHRKQDVDQHEERLCGKRPPDL